MSILTEKSIMRTFETMLIEMPFDKIKIIELVERSEISPNTFYYHYNDKYDLLNSWFDNKLKELTKQAEDFTCWKQNLKIFFHACQDNPKLINHVVDSLSREHLEHYIFSYTDNIFYRYVSSKAEGKGISDQKIREVSRFYSYAFTGYFLQFIWEHMVDNVDERLDRLGELFDKFIESSLHIK